MLRHPVPSQNDFSTSLSSEVLVLILGRPRKSRPKMIFSVLLLPYRIYISYLLDVPTDFDIQILLYYTVFSILVTWWRCFSYFCRFFGCKNRARCSEMLKICEIKPEGVLQAWLKYERQEPSGKKIMTGKLLEIWVIFGKIHGSKNRKFSNFFKSFPGNLISLFEAI